MNRRHFLSLFSTAAACVAVTSVLPVDPERLLWVPGRKTFFLPSVEPVSAVTPAMMRAIAAPNNDLFSGGRGNHFVTADWLAKDIVEQIQKQLKFAKDKAIYDSRCYGRPRPGVTVNVRTPERYR